MQPLKVEVPRALLGTYVRKDDANYLVEIRNWRLMTDIRLIELVEARV